MACRTSKHSEASWKVKAGPTMTDTQQEVAVDGH